MRGDRNCFFRAIAHQLYDDESQHQKVREEGVREVIKNSNLQGNFVAGSFDKTFQTYQQIENGLIVLLYKQPQTSSA